METQDPDATDGARHDAAITRRSCWAAPEHLRAVQRSQPRQGSLRRMLRLWRTRRRHALGRRSRSSRAGCAGWQALISYGYFCLQGVDKSRCSRESHRKPLRSTRSTPTATWSRVQ